ncbi:MAG TPA: hypothetical protein VK614_02495 [Allosphingosinicella sp.]|nr:hypothetical protein [Allosphingosinicella sp.]
MRYQRLAAAAAVATIFVAGEVRAQEAPAPPAEATPAEAAPAPPAEAAATACCTVPARTLVEIEITDTISSKTNHNGDSFAFRLAEPLVIDGRTVAPAGTPGVGEVVHAARARAMGKAGELILAARHIEIGGRQVRLRSFRYGPSQGHDISNATLITTSVVAAVVPILTPIAFLVAGGEVNIPAGTRANAQTAVEVVLAPIE